MATLISNPDLTLFDEIWVRDYGHPRPISEASDRFREIAVVALF